MHTIFMSLCVQWPIIPSTSNGTFFLFIVIMYYADKVFVIVFQNNISWFLLLHLFKEWSLMTKILQNMARLDDYDVFLMTMMYSLYLLHYHNVLHVLHVNIHHYNTTYQWNFHLCSNSLPFSFLGIRDIISKGRQLTFGYDIDGP